MQKLINGETYEMVIPVDLDGSVITSRVGLITDRLGGSPQVGDHLIAVPAAGDNLSAVLFEVDRHDGAGFVTLQNGAMLSYQFTGEGDLPFNTAFDYRATGTVATNTSGTLTITTNIVTVVFETAVIPETYVTPVRDFGPLVTVQGFPFKRHDSALGLFQYLPLHELTVPAVVNLAGLDNSTTNEHNFGCIKIPGDALYTAKNSRLHVTLTADGPLPAGVLSANFSATRTSANYRSGQAFAGGANTATLEIDIASYGMMMIKLKKVADATAPTFLPAQDGILDCNTVGDVEFPLYLRFNAAATPATVHITAIDAHVTITPPDAVPVDPNVTYRDPRKQPFVSDDDWNTPLLDNVLTAAVVFSGDLTGNTVSGTGTAGSDTITVFSTAGIRKGMVPSIGGTKPTTSQYGTPEYDLDNLATINAFGVGNTVKAVLNATQVQLTNPVANAFTVQGREYYNFVHGVFFMVAQQANLLTFQNGGQYYTPGALTGTSKPDSGVTYNANPYWGKIQVHSVADTDPLQPWQSNASSQNAYFMHRDGQYSANYGETFNDFPMAGRTPQTGAGEWLSDDGHITNGNGDGNIALMMENGRYANQHYYGRRTNPPLFTSARCISMDMCGRSIHNQLTRWEGMIEGYSHGTRAYGGDFLGGLLRGWEFDDIPDSFGPMETEAEIRAKCAALQGRIKHKIAFNLCNNQQKSPDYALIADSKARIPFKSYISQYTRYNPVIANGGSGYVPGEVTEIVGGSPLVPMRYKVETIGANGAVTSGFVVDTGQYHDINGLNAAALATSSYGAGVGLVLNALTTQATDITTTALAFPNTVNSVNGVYPATSQDGGYAGSYCGTIADGSLYAIPKSLDLVSMVVDARLHYRDHYTFTYAAFVIADGLQNYGGRCVDTAYFSFIVFQTDMEFTDAQFSDIGGCVGFLAMNLRYVLNDSPSGAGSPVNGNPYQPAVAPLPPIGV